MGQQRLVLPLAVASAAAVAGLWWQGDAPRESSVTELARHEVELQELEARVTELSRDLERVERDSAAHTEERIEPEEKAPRVEAPAVSSEPHDRLAAPRVPPQVHERRVASALSDVFEAEYRDASWAMAQEATYRAAFIDVERYGELVELECKSRICRLDVRPGADPIQVIQNITHSETFSTSGYYLMDPDAGVLRLYVAREGTQLQAMPELDEAMARAAEAR